jgi:hypothetical protein
MLSNISQRNKSPMSDLAQSSGADLGGGTGKSTYGLVHMGLTWGDPSRSTNGLTHTGPLWDSYRLAHAQMTQYVQVLITWVPYRLATWGHLNHLMFTDQPITAIITKIKIIIV